MHAITIAEKEEAVKLVEGEKGYLGEFEGGKGKRKCCNYSIVYNSTYMI